MVKIAIIVLTVTVLYFDDYSVDHYLCYSCSQYFRLLSYYSYCGLAGSLGKVACAEAAELLAGASRLRLQFSAIQSNSLAMPYHMKGCRV